MYTSSGSNINHLFNHSTVPSRSFADHETNLWRAVITQALMDAASRSSKPEAIRSRNEAREWLLGITPDFETVCDNAGLNPGYVRTQSRLAFQRGYVWRLPAGLGWRVQARQRLESQIPSPTRH